MAAVQTVVTMPARLAPFIRPPTAPPPHIGRRVFTVDNFPTTVLQVRVELYLGGVWIDATEWVRYSDRIRITRGRPDGAVQSQPASLRFTGDNIDGRWCAVNPTGAWFGLLRKGVPVRVVVDHGAGLIERFTGEVAELPPRWSTGEHDRYVPVVAAGVTRRLQRGRSSKSAMYRTILAAQPVAYWPLEDAASATVGAPAAGPSTMKAPGVVFAGQSTLVGSSPTPTLGTAGSLTGYVYGGSSTSWWATCAVLTPFVSAAACRWYTTSTAFGVFRVFPPDAAGGRVEVFITDADGESTTTTLLGTVVTATWENVWHVISITAEQSGANVVARLYVDGVLEASSTAAGTLAAVSKFLGNQNAVAITSIAHVAVGDGLTLPDADAADGYEGEPAATRFVRLNREEGVNHVTNALDTAAMGPQPVGTLMTLLGECETTDIGALNEARSGSLWLQGRAERHNAPVALALDHDSSHIKPGLYPSVEDLQIRNDWTITRSGGSSAHDEDTTGSMGTAEPPAGAGRYDDSKTISAYTDAQLRHHASWRVHAGTVEGLRFPGITLNLAHKPELIDAWLACDIGSRITVTNPPAGINPDTIDLVIEGITETLTGQTWDVDLNCTPYQPYEVHVVAATGNRGRVDMANSTLVADVTDVATTISVASTGALWRTGAVSFDIEVGGERMTVTNISGASSPQTFTVTRAINGVTKAQLATIGSVATRVRLWRPGVYAL